jgi:hypothetical protein
MHSVLIIGDLDADLKRIERFDVYLSNFIINNSLVLISPSLVINQYSYEKGDYTATLDHCIFSNFEIVDLNCSFIDSPGKFFTAVFTFKKTDHFTLSTIGVFHAF